MKSVQVSLRKKAYVGQDKSSEPTYFVKIESTLRLKITEFRVILKFCGGYKEERLGRSYLVKSSVAAVLKGTTVNKLW